VQTFKKVSLTFILLVPLLLLTAMPAVAEDDFSAGVKAYIAKDYKIALKIFKKSAEQGDASAQLLLGAMYAKGQGVVQDYKKAVKWYRKSAGQGFAPAQYNLGLMYHKGYGVIQNYKEALKWFRKSAGQGFAPAQYNLGLMYRQGQGVPQDYKEAVKWYRKSAQQGYAKAQFSLGLMYHKGYGVIQNYKEALKWYRKSAEQGDADAQHNIDILLEERSDSDKSRNADMPDIVPTPDTTGDIALWVLLFVAVFIGLYLEGYIEAKSFYEIIDVVSVPLMILNSFGGIISGIWLAIIGEWWAIGYGILILVSGTFIVAILLLPGLAFGTPRIYFMNKGYKLPAYFMSFLSQLYNSALVTVWCCYILFFFLNNSDNSSFLPLLIWSYGVATGVWKLLAYSHKKNDNSVYYLITTFFAQIAYVLIIALSFMQLSSINIFVIFGSVMLVPAIVNTVIMIQQSLLLDTSKRSGKA